MTNFPTSKDDLIDNVDDVLADHINNLQDKVGSGTDDNTPALNKILRGTGAGTSEWDFDIKDEDDMTSDSATAVPTQQSVKAYHDADMPAGDVVGTTDTQTLTNKTLTEPVINLNNELLHLAPEGAMQMFQFSLSDDAATSFSPGVDHSIVFVIGDNFAAANGMAAIWNESSGSSYGYVITTITALEATTGVLSGTTGTDGKITISGHTDGKIYLENRRGGSFRGLLLVVGYKA